MSSFPTYVFPDGEPTYQRAAWCHGDPGVAAVLLLAAAALDRPRWRQIAIDTALASAARAPDVTGNLDAALCHGSTGMGHLLNRMYQQTGDERLRDQAAAWFGRALDARRPGHGVGGWQSRLPDVAGQPPRWHATPGLLQGAAGIGLALLAAATPRAADWDRALLISPASPLARSLTGSSG